MTKHRMTPFFARTSAPNLNVGESADLQTHLLELVALEALISAIADPDEITSGNWSTSVSKRIEGGAISFAAFRGKIVPDAKTGRPEAELTSERHLSLQAFRDLGLFDDLGRADEPWENDDVALGINFSRLHRVARMIENRAPDFMRGLQSRIEEDMRATATYSDLEDAAERRRKRAEEERQREREAWRIEQAERERLAQERREKEHAAMLEFKRRAAEIAGRSFETDHELDVSVQTSVNTSTKGYENEFGAPMPEGYARHAPFTWARVGGRDQPRIFFDARGQRIPEPS